MSEYLEPDFAEPYKAWKASPTPQTGDALMKTLQPTIEEVTKTHLGRVDPLTLGRARRMTMQSLGTYEPHRSRLKTHLYNQLQGLKRWSAQQSQPVHVPERVVLDRRRMGEIEQELADELGRDPTDDELSNRSGYSLKRLTKVRSWKPAVAEGTLEASETGLLGATFDGRSRQIWLDMVYDDLDPLDKQIMAHTLGMYGREPLPNHELARRLKRTPGAISQRKARIQKLLDQEADFAPFLG